MALSELSNPLNDKLKVLTFGAGAIGTYIGGSLALAVHQVVFVEKPAIVDELRDRGLRLDLTLDPRRKTNEAFQPQGVVATLALLVERNSLRAIERLRHHSPNAILHWLDLAGQHAAALSAHLIRNLHLTQAQIDELWTFVKKSKSTCK